MVKQYLVLILLLLTQSGIARAVCVATGPDGKLGEESCAELQVLLSIPAQARVSQLGDFDLGQFDYETAPQTMDDFCIWYNTEQFSMVISSNNSIGDNTFNLKGNNNNTLIPYELTWFNQPGAAGKKLSLTNQEDIPQQPLVVDQARTTPKCIENNTSINITVPLKNLQGKPEDSYSDTITVTVSVQ